MVDDYLSDRTLTIPYYDRVRDEFMIPPLVANETAALVGKTIPAIRQRRKRMMARLLTFVNGEGA
jgi:hypothetical protein